MRFSRQCHLSPGESEAATGANVLPLELRILTVTEVAEQLRCSKAHVHNLINGNVRGAPLLPSVQLGRRRLVLLTTLTTWISKNEQNSPARS